MNVGGLGLSLGLTKTLLSCKSFEMRMVGSEGIEPPIHLQDIHQHPQVFIIKHLAHAPISVDTHGGS